MPQVTDLQDIRQRLEVDRPWAAFALADLELPYSNFATWFCPADNPLAVALLYRPFTTPVVICTGPSRYLEGVLDEVDATIGEARDLYAVIRPAVLPLIKDHYCAKDERPMVRMVLDASRYQPVVSEAVGRLGPDDLASVQRLYVDEPPDFFLPARLKDGIYYGVREADQVIAIAGTHVVASNVSVGALGHIYTRSDRRGRGLATAVTRAVTSHLVKIGITTIVLNVREANHPALRVYERLGYKRYCNYYEVMASRRPNPPLQPAAARDLIRHG